MKDLFQELYNKVLSLFNSAKQETDPTKNLAVNRLKTVLMQDRAGFSERAIQALKEEITAVVSKFIEMKDDDFELQIDANESGETILNLSIPVLRSKTDEEIDLSAKKQQDEIHKKVLDIVKELEEIIKNRTNIDEKGEIDSALIEQAAKKVSEQKAADTNETEDEQASDSENKTEAEEEKPETNAICDTPDRTASKKA